MKLIRNSPLMALYISLATKGLYYHTNDKIMYHTNYPQVMLFPVFWNLKFPMALRNMANKVKSPYENHIIINTFVQSLIKII